jgi:hypothetical protein
MHLEAQLAALSELKKDQLGQHWNQNFNESPPEKLRKELMVPILAYRIQEREFGGLFHSARSRIVQSQSLRKDKRPDSSPRADATTGTKLIRMWRGEVHEVICVDDGFEYRGEQFASLSRIARKITGTQWSGPLFFGTKRK